MFDANDPSIRNQIWLPFHGPELPTLDDIVELDAAFDRAIRRGTYAEVGVAERAYRGAVKLFYRFAGFDA